MLRLTVTTVLLALVVGINCFYNVDSIFVANKPQPKIKIREVRVPNAIFLINIQGIKNGSAEHVNDILHNDLVEKAMNDTTSESSPMFMLVVKHEDELQPVDLNDLVEEVEKEGFTVEKLITDDNRNETRLVKLHVLSKANPIEENPNQQIVEAYAGNRLLKARVKRSPCISCMLGFKKKKGKGGMGGGGGCGCQCGGCYQHPQVRTVYVPVQSHPVCNPCMYG